MNHDTYGEECAHPHIANSLNSLQAVYHEQGKLENTLELHKKRNEMEQDIYGEECVCPDTATSLTVITWD